MKHKADCAVIPYNMETSVKELIPWSKKISADQTCRTDTDLASSSLRYTRWPEFSEGAAVLEGGVWSGGGSVEAAVDLCVKALTEINIVILRKKNVFAGLWRPHTYSIFFFLQFDKLFEVNILFVIFVITNLGITSFQIYTIKSKAGWRSPVNNFSHIYEPAKLEFFISESTDSKRHISAVSLFVGGNGILNECVFHVKY